MIHKPRIIAVGGFTSNVGKTTLMCDLLRVFPGWEAIKTTRGHYRSCGKDPHACCVSHLLSDEPVLRSGREETYAPGKDTGRYWEAGASNVHWLIAEENQIEAGIKLALERVCADGVFVEGNSFTEFVDVDALIMTLRESDTRIKRSAKRALEKTSALYVWEDGESTELKTRSLADGSEISSDITGRCAALPRYTKESFSDLVSSLRVFTHSVAA
jgi:molybdopterin-guanine dinucleotide biosynthesis protein